MSTRKSIERIWHVHVFRLAWPIMVSMLSYTAMTVADAMYVGQLGTAPLAAIGLAATVVHLGTAFGNGLLGGVRVQVAKATGARQVMLGGHYAWQGLWLAVFLGALVASLSPWGPRVFGAMGASPEVTALASEYYAVRMFGAPIVFVYTVLSGWFQGRGDTRTPMVAALISNGLNIVLNPVFIFGAGPIPALGIEGAALVTVLGLGVGCLVLLVAGFGALTEAFVWPVLALIAPIWRIGSPIGVQYFLEVASFTLFGAMLASSGDVQLAAHVILVRICMVSFLPGYAIGEAAGVLVGQAMGAEKPYRARRAWWAATQQGLLLMGACAVLFVCAPDLLISIFGAEESVAEVARTVLMVAAGFQVFDAAAMVALGALVGAGDTRFVLLITVGCAWFVKIPVSMALVWGLDLGALGAWLALGAEIMVVAGLACWRIRGAAWLQQHRQEAQALREAA